MANLPNNKEAWLRLLKQTSIPSFNASINALSSAEEYTSAHSSELARTILKDPNLTTSVLKLANSAHFNRSGQPIRTISRSIMVLGHKSIKEVCASCMLMEQFTNNAASEHLVSLLARSFHSAIQAKEIALMKGQKSTEEIFISALLLSLGEISVYSAVEPQDPTAVALRNSYPISAGKEKDIIGCYFNDLTLGLCQAWNIAPMISELLGGKYSEDSPIRSILLGSSLAVACEVNGVEKAVKNHLKSITRYTGKSLEEVTEKLEKATIDTQNSLSQFGIQLDVKLARASHVTNNLDEVKVTIDKAIQLDIIQELTLLAREKNDINLILQTLLEGMQRGAGFQCSLVALYNPNKTRIEVKHAIEKQNGQSKDNFSFSCNQDIPEIKQKVINNNAVVLQTKLREQGATLRHILKCTGSKNAIWGPLVVEDKVIGCFYANNGVGGSVITQEQIDAFQLFVYQAGFLLQKFKK